MKVRQTVAAEPCKNSEMKNLPGILTLSILILLSFGCKKSPDNETPDTQNLKLITGNFNFNGGYNTLCNTKDNGFAVAAPVDNRRIYVAVTNSAFDVLWSKTLGSCIYDVGGIVESSDQGFVIVCNYHDTTTYPDKLYVDLIKLNNVGDLVWEKKYRFRYMYENGFAVKETPDQGFIIATTHDKWNNQGLNFIELFKINAGGDSVWSVDYPDYYSAGHDVQVTSDHGFIAVGERIILKTDSSGNMQWEKELPYILLTNVRVLPDGSYMVLGTKDVHTPTSSNESDYLLMKFDANGTKLWEKLYDVGNYEYAGNLCLTAEGGFMFTGLSTIGSYYQSVSVIIKTDVNGNQLSMKTINPGSITEPRGLTWFNGSYIYYGGTTISNGTAYYLMLLRFNL
jgi:hypothetical protein